MTVQTGRLGVDIGGTFTDVVLEIAGVLHSTKVLTTYGAPEDAIIDGMQQVCAKEGSHVHINQHLSVYANEGSKLHANKGAVSPCKGRCISSIPGDV